MGIPKSTFTNVQKLILRQLGVNPLTLDALRNRLPAHRLVLGMDLQALIAARWVKRQIRPKGAILYELAPIAKAPKKPLDKRSGRYVDGQMSRSKADPQPSVSWWITDSREQFSASWKARYSA